MIDPRERMNARSEKGQQPPPPAPAAATAASLVPQINEAHELCVNAERSALPHAISCGRLLNTAQETVDATGKGKWLKWLEANCPAIHQTTANDYMRLAKHEDMIKGAALSIRAALKQLPKGEPRRPRRQQQQRQQQREPTDEEALDASAGPPSAGKDILHDAVQDLSPKEIFALVRDTFDREKLEALTNELVAYLRQTEARK
jgi:hypothetical protein